MSRLEITKVINDLYDVYTKSDLAWVDFYNTEYDVVTSKGAIRTVHRDSLRSQWRGIYERYDVILNDRGTPTLEVSDDQILHYNTFDEILIKKTTRDTIVNIGTWVALWKKQEDGSWKIEFETYHAK